MISAQNKKGNSCFQERGIDQLRVQENYVVLLSDDLCICPQGNGGNRLNNNVKTRFTYLVKNGFSRRYVFRNVLFCVIFVAGVLNVGFRSLLCHKLGCWIFNFSPQKSSIFLFLLFQIYIQCYTIWLFIRLYNMCIYLWSTILCICICIALFKQSSTSV